MKLYCSNNGCGYEFLVHSGHYWRYPNRVNKCPKCGSVGRPDELGKKIIESRNMEANKMRQERERKSRLEEM